MLLGLTVASSSYYQAKLESIVQLKPLENTVPNIYRGPKVGEIRPPAQGHGG